MTKIFVEKNAYKCIYRLNKQQTERQRNIANISEPFLQKSFYEEIIQKAENLEEKCTKFRVLTV